jgi:hypothetical protein
MSQSERILAPTAGGSPQACVKSRESSTIAGRVTATVLYCPGSPIRGQAVGSCCPGLFEEGM